MASQSLLSVLLLLKEPLLAWANYKRDTTELAQALADFYEAPFQSQQVPLSRVEKLVPLADANLWVAVRTMIEKVCEQDRAQQDTFYTLYADTRSGRCATPNCGFTSSIAPELGFVLKSHNDPTVQAELCQSFDLRKVCRKCKAVRDVEIDLPDFLCLSLWAEVPKDINITMSVGGFRYELVSLLGGFIAFNRNADGSWAATSAKGVANAAVGNGEFFHHERASASYARILCYKKVGQPGGAPQPAPAPVPAPAPQPRQPVASPAPVPAPARAAAPPKAANPVPAADSKWSTFDKFCRLCQLGDKGRVSRLLDRIDRKETNNAGDYPISFAIAAGQLQIVDLLLNEGWGPNLVDSQGPLLNRVLFNNDDSPIASEMARLLLSKCADVSHITDADFERIQSLTTQYWVKRAQNNPPPTQVYIERLKAHQLAGLFGVRFALVGQQLAAEAVERALFSWKVTSIMEESPKPAVLLFCGPPGHGKTEMAVEIAKNLHIEHRKISCQEHKSLFDMFGASAPYVDSHKGSELNNFISDYAEVPKIVILDEFEKTTLEIQQGFITPFENGTWTDRRKREGSTVSCANTMWILTTNAVDQDIIDYFEQNPKAREEKSDLGRQKILEQLKDLVLRRIGVVISSPLARRMDIVIPFIPFTEEETLVLADIQLKKLQHKYSFPAVDLHTPGNIKVHVAPEVRTRAAAAYRVEEGVSSIRRIKDDTMSKINGKWLSAESFDEAYVFMKEGFITVSQRPPPNNAAADGPVPVRQRKPDGNGAQDRDADGGSDSEDLDDIDMDAFDPTRINK